MKKKFYKRTIILIFLGMFLAAFCVAVWLILFTHFGSAYVSKKIFNSLSEGKDFVWKENEGTHIRGMMYKDIVLKDIKWFPFPNELKIQELKMDISSFSLRGVDFFIDNGRLVLPDADPILFNGKIEKQLIDFNFYTNSVTDSEIKDLFEEDILKGAKGSLAKLDIFIKGTIDEPNVSGEFEVEKIEKNGFSLEQAPSLFNVTLKNVNNALGIYGLLTVKEGMIGGKKTALIRLGESKIIFDGDPAKPSFDVKATSIVERIKMNISFKGDLIEPDLQISSNPSMPKERLLLALATNKTWQNTEEQLNKGDISPDLARDFIEYFILGGQVNSFVEKFGLKSFSVKYDKQGKGVVVTKDLSNKLEGRYEVEERNQNEGKPNVSQKVGGEYKLTDSVSVGVEKELKGKEKTEDFVNEINKPETNDKVYLKYKKEF